MKVISPSEIAVRVWERGSGETLSCGTGACAAVVASRSLGKITSAIVKVILPGGDLEIEWEGTGGAVHLTGPSRQICSGFYDCFWNPFKKMIANESTSNIPTENTSATGSVALVENQKQVDPNPTNETLTQELDKMSIVEAPATVNSNSSTNNNVSSNQ